MCQPFHQHIGDWWRYNNTWVLVSRISATVDTVEDFIAQKQGRGAGINIEVSFYSDPSIEGEEHLLACAMHALRAQENNDLMTRTIGLEALLYASGQPHVNKAITNAGIEGGDETMWALFLVKNASALPKKEALEICLGIEFIESPWSTDNTLEALERAALLRL